MLQNRLFSALASRSGFGAASFDAVARSSIVFCNAVSADRIVMAASRLLGAAAACVILLSFAAEDRKSYIGVAASRLRQWFVNDCCYRVLHGLLDYLDCLSMVTSHMCCPLVGICSSWLAIVYDRCSFWYKNERSYTHCTRAPVRVARIASIMQHEKQSSWWKHIVISVASV